MAFDYSKLRGRLVEKGIRQYDLAKYLGISEASLSRKMQNWSPFTQVEIGMICKHLSITDAEIGAFFFAERVKETSPNQAS